MKFKKSLSALIIVMLLAIFTIPVSAKAKLTYGNFVKIKMGSNYSQVVKLIGKGKKEGSSSAAGIKTTIYSWTSGLSVVSISFENGKLDSKTQAGLYKSYAKVSSKNYKKIKNGMSYTKVKTILGKGGQLSEESKLLGVDSKVYQWQNSNGYIVTCTFTNNVMDSKSQYSL